MKCTNALCGKNIGVNDPHVKADVVGHTEYWCDNKCLAEWEQQNKVFLIAADAFTDKHQVYGHRRRKQLFS